MTLGGERSFMAKQSQRKFAKRQKEFERMRKAKEKMDRRQGKIDEKKETETPERVDTVESPEQP
jgi:hypothetical protein